MPGDNRRFVTPDDVETQIFPWGAIKWLSEPRITNAERITAGLVVLQPGKGHTRHNHPGVEEVLYVVSGSGEQMVEDEQGRPVRRQVDAGDLVHIPPDVYHETINTGWEPMRILAVLLAAGTGSAPARHAHCVVVPPGELPKR